jgi:hypothetical protein
MFWAVGVVVLAVVLIIWAWQWNLLPRDVIATGTVQLADGKVLKTRQYWRTSREQQHKSPAPGPLVKEAVWEIELPSGRWVDCGGDCAETARRALE